MGPAQPTEHRLHLSDTHTETLTLREPPAPRRWERESRAGPENPRLPSPQQAHPVPRPPSGAAAPSSPRGRGAQRQRETVPPTRAGVGSPAPGLGRPPCPARPLVDAGATGGAFSLRSLPPPPASAGKELPHPPHPRPRQQNREAGQTASRVPLGAPRPAQRPAERAGWAGAESGQHLPARPLPMGQLRGDPASSRLAELRPAWAPRIHHVRERFPLEKNAGGKARAALRQAWPWEEKEIFPRHKHGAEHQLLPRSRPPDCDARLLPPGRSPSAW